MLHFPYKNQYRLKFEKRLAQRRAVPFPFDKAIGVSVLGFVRAVKLCRVAHHPWRYGRSHNRTRGFSASSSASPPRIHLRPDGRTRQRVKQSQFGCKSSSILHFVIRPTSRPARRESTSSGASARLRSDAQVHHGSCDYFGSTLSLFMKLCR